MFCSKCGCELADEAVVCVKCGCLVNSSLNNRGIRQKQSVDDVNDKTSSILPAKTNWCGFVLGMFAILATIFLCMVEVAYGDFVPAVFNIFRYTGGYSAPTLAVIFSLVELKHNRNKVLPLLGLIFGAVSVLANTITVIVWYFQ